MKVLIVILNVFGLSYIQLALGQNRIINSHYHGWYMFFGSYNLNSKIGLHTEYQWRRNDIIKNWQQSLARIGLIYKWNNEISFTMGYGHIITYPYGKQPVSQTFLEHRIWEQVLISHKIQNSDIKHRYRLEHRWLENSSHWKYFNRFRYQFWIDIPLLNISENKKLLFTFYDEAFINFGKNVQKNIFDQNRLYGSIGLMINPNTIVRIGYMNHIIMKSDGIHEEMNHTLQISLHQNLSLKKSEN